VTRSRVSPRRGARVSAKLAYVDRSFLQAFQKPRGSRGFRSFGIGVSAADAANSLRLRSLHFVRCARTSFFRTKVFEGSLRGLVGSSSFQWMAATVRFLSSVFKGLVLLGCSVGWNVARFDSHYHNYFWPPCALSLQLRKRHIARQEVARRPSFASIGKQRMFHFQFRLSMQGISAPTR
jgi:hypothetical protein